MNREQATEQISKALTATVFKGTSVVPFVKPDVSDIVRRINRLTEDRLQIQTPAEFFGPQVPISALDRAAKDYTRHAQLVVTSSGVATGTVGLPGIAPNAGILVSATVGLVRRHALVYGFTDIEDHPEDKVPLLMGFAAAAGAQGVIGQASVLMGQVAGRVAIDAAARQAAQLVLAQQISYQMALQMVKQAALKVVPVVSSATSGTLNYAFVRAAGRRSAAYWRERHLIVRQAGPTTQPYSSQEE